MEKIFSELYDHLHNASYKNSNALENYLFTTKQHVILIFYIASQVDKSSTLENICIETVESGKMTKDLALLIHGKDLNKSHYLNTQKFLTALKESLEVKIG